MFDILLIIQVVVAALLLIVILMQKSGDDGLSGLGGGNSGGGVMSAHAANNFITKLTVILITIFMFNAIILANLSTKKHGSIIEKIEKTAPKSVDDGMLPMAD